MTTIELHRLAGAIATLRPDWPAQSLQTFLERHLQHRALRDVAVALTYVATDPTSSTPARVLEAGPWWQAAATTDVPTTRNDCARHPHVGIRVDPRTGDRACSGCRNDQLEDPDAAPTFDRRPVPDEVRQLRHRQPSTPDGETTPAAS